MSKAELSSLMSTMDEIGRRIASMAESSRANGHEDEAIDLYEVERSIRSAVRRLSKVTDAQRRG
ncbi:MAG TPA: hypothetical protein VNB24_06565 [Acidimicrobiales bacterium]|nr:hypothetical protein [Acidimicrobiales bacterium]